MVVRAAAALASSSNVRAKDVNVVVDATSVPVKYGSASAAVVRPARAVNVASADWNDVEAEVAAVPRPRVVLAVAASVSSIRDLPNVVSVARAAALPEV
jgi:hypothetical protein